MPKLIDDVNYQDIKISRYQDINISKFNLEEPIRDYNVEALKYYHQFNNACLGKDRCITPFSYASRLTETILLGVFAGRFPNQTLH
jgi:hypothetical protein